MMSDGEGGGGDNSPEAPEPSEADQLKSKVAEFRTNNIELQKRVDELSNKFKDVDLESYSEMQEIARQKRDKELIDAKQFDVLIEERTKALKSDLEGKLSQKEQALAEAMTTLESVQARYEIEGAASKAMAEFRINPEMNDAVLAMVKTKFSIQNGSVVSMLGQEIEAGSDGGNLTVNGFIKSLPDSFKIQSTGSNAKGGEIVGGMKPSTSRGIDAIRAGLAKL